MNFDTFWADIIATLVSGVTLTFPDLAPKITKPPYFKEF